MESASVQAQLETNKAAQVPLVPSQLEAQAQTLEHQDPPDIGGHEFQDPHMRHGHHTRHQLKLNFYLGINHTLKR